MSDRGLFETVCRQFAGSVRWLSGSLYWRSNQRRFSSFLDSKQLEFLQDSAVTKKNNNKELFRKSKRILLSRQRKGAKKKISGP